MTPHEIVLGDDHQSITLKFERDGLWVAGEYNGQEIPHKMIPWSKFESVRRDVENSMRPTLYETLQRERGWSSAWPDMKSFLDAVHHYFSRDHYKIEAATSCYCQFKDPDEHMVLTYEGNPVWDFGPLTHAEDLAWRIAFHRFEENTDRILARVKTLQRPPWWKVLISRR